MTERESLKNMIKSGYLVIVNAFPILPLSHGYGKYLEKFEKDWIEAIKTLGLNPKDMAIIVDFNKWIDEA